MPNEADDRQFRHELKTPINHIVGYSELLIEEEELPAPLPEQLKEIKGIANEIASLASAFTSDNADCIASLKSLATTMAGKVTTFAQNAPPSAREDTDRIASAAARLQALLAEIG